MSPPAATPARRAHWLPALGVAGVAVVLASGHVCARFAFAHGVTVVTAATTRTVAASLLLLALLRIRGIAVLPLPRAARAAAALGALIAAQTALVQVSVKLVPVTLAILTMYTFPFFTAIGMRLTRQGRMTPRLVASLACAFAGLALVLGVGGEAPAAAGILAALGAALAFSTALVLTPKLAPDLPAPLRAFFMVATAASIFVVASAATGDFRLPETDAARLGLAGLSLLYAIGFAGLFLLLPLLGPIAIAVTLNLEPLAVAAISWAALGEALTPAQVAGGLLVVAAVVYYQARGERP
ncbi:MAG: DMT family transporter [Burkholderiales bacterium]|nr:DMT family transporter [Burkholderiales bacterium]